MGGLTMFSVPTSVWELLKMVAGVLWFCVTHPHETHPLLEGANTRCPKCGQKVLR